MTGPALALKPDEAVAVGEVARAFVEALPAERGAEFVALADAAELGSVPAELGGRLERVCALALQTGKAHAIGSAETERLVGAVYRRTPGGSTLAESTAAVNRALTEFAGRTLRSARVTARIPGQYRLDLAVDGIAVSIGIGAAGIAVDSLRAG